MDVLTKGVGADADDFNIVKWTRGGVLSFNRRRTLRRRISRDNGIYVR